MNSGLTCMVHDACRGSSGAIRDFSWSGTVNRMFQLGTPSQEVVHAISGVC
jgi:hypothetical protein